LAARTYWAAVTSDAAAEAGGGKARLQTDRTRRLNRPRPPHAASNLPFTLPQNAALDAAYTYT